MKRALLAMIILTAGTIVFYSLRSASAGIRDQVVAQQAAWQAQTQQLARLKVEQEQVQMQVTETKKRLAELPKPPQRDQLMEKVLSADGLKNLSAVESEKLLAELDCNWNTTGDYLVVSKKSLDGIDYEAMKSVKLTAAARETLAINPAEQAAIEGMTKQLGEAQSDWAKSHVQRTEPNGDVLAQYSLPVDSDFSKVQLATYTNGIYNALGEQRALWLQNHSLDWMQTFGLLTGPGPSDKGAEVVAAASSPEYKSQPTTMTLSRSHTGDNSQISYELQQAGSTMSTVVSPWQPFPEAFRAIFPGGWKDVAEREGFELPKEFKKK
jgi:hypothetical protein